MICMFVAGRNTCLVDRGLGLLIGGVEEMITAIYLAENPFVRNEKRWWIAMPLNANQAQVLR